MSDNLNDFLQELAEAGVEDSEGEFSLSLAHAHRKLQEFQLQNPHLFALNVVSAALLCGAESLDFRYDRGDTLVTFSGRRLDRQELESLFTSRDPVLSELKTALLSLRSINPLLLRFESEATLDWTGDEPEVISNSRSEGQPNLLRIERRGKGVIESIKAVPRHLLKPQWQQPLQAAARYANLDIRVSGRSLFGNRTVQVSVPALRLDHPEYLLPPIRAYGGSTEQILRRQSPGDFSALLAMRYEAQERQLHSKICIVYRGIAYSRSSSEVDLGGVNGLVFCENLQKNLSQTDLVEDEAFRRLFANLRASILTFIVEDLTSSTVSREVTGAWHDTIFWAGNKLRESGKLDEACRIEAWAYAHRNVHHGEGFTRLDEFAGRYDSPPDFLWHYLRYEEAVVQELSDLTREPLEIVSLLQQLNDSFAWNPRNNHFLRPWLDRSPPRLLGVLAHRLMSKFPATLHWQHLWSLLSMCKGDTELLERLHERMTRSLPRSNQTEVQRALVEAALFLESKGKLDFREWFKRAGETGVLTPGPQLERSLEGLGVAAEDLTLLEHAFEVSSSSELAVAGGMYSRFVHRQATSLSGFLATIERTLRGPQDSPEGVNRRLMALAAGNQDLGLVVIPDSPWSRHRQALGLTCQGHTGRALKLHKEAHRELKGHWLSHLLMAESNLSLGDSQSARHYAEDVLRIQPDNLIAQEILAELTPGLLPDRRQAWVEIAEHPAAPEVLVAIAYREALMCGGVFGGLLGWVRLQIRSNLAHQNVAHLFPSGNGWHTPADRFSEYVVRQPEIVRYCLRNMRATSDGPAAAKLWARSRLLEMLSTDGSLEWRSDLR